MKKRLLNGLLSLLLLVGLVGCAANENQAMQNNRDGVNNTYSDGNHSNQRINQTRNTNQMQANRARNQNNQANADQGNQSLSAEPKHDQDGTLLLHDVEAKTRENAISKAKQNKGSSVQGQNGSLSNGAKVLKGVTGKKPKNIIYLIGDGMSFGQMEVARLFEHGKTGSLFLQTLPHVALTKTYSADNHVTDSGAAGTALATGVKTNNGMVGVDPNANALVSIMDSAKTAGKKVGVVSTNTVFDATPAAFYAKVKSRGGSSEIARQLAESDIDVALGGGKNAFLPTAQNGVNLIDQMKEKGYTYVEDRDSLSNANGDKLLGLFSPSFMNYLLDRDDVNSKEPSLLEMTTKALDTLSKGKNGFFVMIEGARIDHAAHAADFGGVWKETIDFDNAVRYSVDWAEKNGDTLVVVLADHETMGIAPTEPMNIEKLKAVGVSPEFIASKMSWNSAENRYSPDSVRSVFKQYADIELSDAQIDQFNSRILTTAGTRVAPHIVGWEIGTIIAEHYQAGALNTQIRSLSGTGGHTAIMAPIFAYGVGAEAFNGVLENTDVPKMMAQIAGFSLTPDQKQTGPNNK